MTQINLNNTLPLPEVSGDKYRCYPDPLDVHVEMISGREVIETRGDVYIVEYSYDYMGNDLQRSALAILRSRRPFVCTVLRDDGTYYTSTFILRSLEPPSMAFSRRKGDEEADFWHKISFVLREEKPHG